MTCPITSPWGRVQTSKELEQGICIVSTAGHGGIKIPPKLNRKIPEYMRDVGGWYEEDSEWSIPGVIFPELLRKEYPKADVIAKETLRNCYPANYEKFFNVELKKGESRVKDKKFFEEEHKGDWVVRAAWGDWHKDVPKGFVGVVATKGRRTLENFYKTPYPRKPSATPEAYFLVPEKEYSKRGRFNFIVNPTKHKQVAKIIT